MKNIKYNGKSLSAQKHSKELCSHYYSDDEAFYRAKYIASEIGVKRLANVTGYDRIGIPVINSVKPSVKGSCVQHGKGMTVKAAKVSALMESFERHYALNASIDSFMGTYNEIKEQFNMIPFEKLLLTKNTVFHKDIPIYWTVGWDIMNQIEVAAPLAMTELAGNKTMANNLSTGHFHLTSNGLASGFDFLEAISQALFEIVERDAITCNTYASSAANSFFPLKRVDLNTIKHPEVNSLLKRFFDADVYPVLFDCTVDTDIPVYNCYLLDKKDPSFMVTHGMGADLDYVSAMARSMNEAAQSRAVFLSGVRDITFAEEYEHLTALRSDAYYSILEEKNYNTVDMSAIEPVIVDNYEEIISICLNKLKRAGLEQVIVFPLTKEEDGVWVVRVIVPGMEGYILPSSMLGSRAVKYFKKGIA